MAKRVLLFESLTENVCAFLAPLFEKHGFHTQLETDYETCLEAVRLTPPDVVLAITNNVKDARAFELAEAIRLVHPKCGFVFLFGSDGDGRDKFLTSGYKFQLHPIPMLIPELMKITAEAADSPEETFVIPRKE